MSDRTLDSENLRLDLYRKQNGKCAICGSSLPSDWHADHIIPYSKGGETNFFNMQAVCPSCNLQKSDSLNMRDAKEQRGLTQQDTLIDWDAFRPGQREAVQVVIDRIQRALAWTSIVLPTRYGKTDVAKMSAYLLHQMGLISAAVILEPSRSIVGQNCGAEGWKETAKRYNITSGVKSREIKTVSDLREPAPNGEWFLGMTTQLFNDRTDLITDWASHLDLPVLLIVDECHQASEVNKWGNSAREFVEDDNFGMFMTATAKRSDDADILGFETEFVEESESEQAVVSDLEDEDDKVLVEVYKSIRGRKLVKPHHRTTFKQAWNEGVLCDISHSRFDVELEKVKYSGPNEYRFLSDLPVTTSRRELGHIVRDDHVVERGVNQAVRILQSFREKDERPQLIIFCGNDQPNDNPDRHARMIQNRVQAATSDLTVVRATNNSDREIRKRLKSFSSGDSDVLISKMAAGVGMDFPNAKVLLDLSPVRTYASWVQRVMRIATKVDWTDVAYLVTPDDIASRVLSKVLISYSDGDADDAADTLMSTTRLENKIDEYITTTEPEDDEGYIVNGTDHADFHDNKGNQGLADQWESAQNLQEIIPWIRGIMTDAELAERFKENNASLKLGDKALSDEQDENDLVQDTKQEAGRLKSKILHEGGWADKDKADNSLVHLVVEKHFNGQYQRWGEAAQFAWNKVVLPKVKGKLNSDSKAKIAKDEGIENLEDLKVILATVRRLRKQYKQQVYS